MSRQSKRRQGSIVSASDVASSSDTPNNVVEQITLRDVGGWPAHHPANNPIMRDLRAGRIAAEETERKRANEARAREEEARRFVAHTTGGSVRLPTRHDTYEDTRRQLAAAQLRRDVASGIDVVQGYNNYRSSLYPEPTPLLYSIPQPAHRTPAPTSSRLNTTMPIRRAQPPVDVPPPPISTLQETLSEKNDEIEEQQELPTTPPPGTQSPPRTSYVPPTTEPRTVVNDAITPRPGRGLIASSGDVARSVAGVGRSVGAVAWGGLHSAASALYSLATTPTETRPSQPTEDQLRFLRERSMQFNNRRRSIEGVDAGAIANAVASDLNHQFTGVVESLERRSSNADARIARMENEIATIRTGLGNLVTVTQYQDLAESLHTRIDQAEEGTADVHRLVMDTNNKTRTIQRDLEELRHMNVWSQRYVESLVDRRILDVRQTTDDTNRAINVQAQTLRDMQEVIENFNRQQADTVTMLNQLRTGEIDQFYAANENFTEELTVEDDDTKSESIASVAKDGKDPDDDPDDPIGAGGGGFPHFSKRNALITKTQNHIPSFDINLDIKLTKSGGSKRRKRPPPPKGVTKPRKQKVKLDISKIL